MDATAPLCFLAFRKKHMSSFPSPFAAPEPLSGLDPSDYVAGFSQPEASGGVPQSDDPRVTALFRRKQTFANKRFRAAKASRNDLRAFVSDVRNQGVGVAGAGVMGVSIAAAFLNARVPVLARDPAKAACDSARSRVTRELLELRWYSGEALENAEEEETLVVDRVAEFFRVTQDLEALAAKPVVIESATEKPKLKAKFYHQLEDAATTSILLLTNTSSPTIAELSEALPRDEEDKHTSVSRFAGFHFFNPVTRRRPVEIAVGAQTSPETIARAVSLGREINKLPMVVGDSPGFLVNRLLQAFLNEALAELDEGVPAERVEALSRRFGMKVPPLRVIDEIGVDVAMLSGKSFYKAFPERTHVSTILPGLLRAERYGRKTRHGFYRYESRSGWQDDATFDADRETLRRLADPTIGSIVENVDPRLHTDEALGLRSALVILFEAARLVEEGVVGSLRDVDAGLVLALGAPRDRGGICYWALSFGLDILLEAAKEFEPLGARFKAPELLVKLSEELCGRRR